MQKQKRLLAIEKIIDEEDIFSQEVLLRRLKVKGIICTQATLSRDLRQLGVSRIPGRTGGYRYHLPGRDNTAMNPEIKRNIVPVVLDLVEAKGLLVIRTLPGNANATAYYIDNAARYEIAGTIAGDDTILVIPRNGITMSQVHACLELVMPGVHKQVGESGRDRTKK